MNEKVVNSVQEFIDFSDEHRCRLSGGKGNPSSFMFRGMTDCTWRLLPSIYREIPPLRQYLYGPVAPHERGSIMYDEVELLSDFKQYAASYLSGLDPTNDLAWLFYAQHHGLPTRLLDFTSNPLVALYFCCSDAIGLSDQIYNAETGMPEEQQVFPDGVIWGYDTNILDLLLGTLDKVQYIPEQPEEKEKVLKCILAQIHRRYNQHAIKYTRQKPLLISPPFMDVRMNAQSSRFLIWGADHHPLDEMLSDAEVATHGFKTDFILKAIIPKNAKHNILRQLNILGVNTMTMFPGLDGIAKHIVQEYVSSMKVPLCSV